MTNDPNENAKKDWNELAVEALDLWQNHLNSLASDPKIKEDMTRFVTPMTQMFSQWTSMMQAGMQNMTGFATAAQDDAQQAGDEPVATAPAAEETVAQNTQTNSTDGAVADVKSETPDRAECDIRGDSGSTDSHRLGTDIDTLLAVNDPEPEPKQDLKPEPAAAVAQPAPRGRAASTDGTRDLAQLAGRLAQLERELDSLRPKTKRSADGSAGDTAVDGVVQRVAGAD